MESLEIEGVPHGCRVAAELLIVSFEEGLISRPALIALLATIQDETLTIA